jgi:MFS transporter, MCT family, aspergillic acid transporter
MYHTFPANGIDLDEVLKWSKGPIFGRIFDKWGPRHLILGGSVLHVFGLMMASISTKYYQLILSQGLCSALGLTAIVQPCMTSIPTWFDRKRGLAYGIASTGSSIGGVIFPIMLSRLINDVGFGWAMRISAFMMLALLIIVNVTVRCRTPPALEATKNMSLFQPFREVDMMLLTFGFFLLGLGVFIPIGYSIIQAIQNGMSIDLAQYLLPILNGAR